MVLVVELVLMLEALLVAGCWLLVAGRWLLVVGCWLLVVGCSLLVVGCWLLVVFFGVVVVDMEVMVADMVDTDTDVNADLLMLTMDMVVMVDTVMAVNLASSQFITPKSNYTTSFQHTKEYIQKAKSQPLHCIY